MSLLLTLQAIHFCGTDKEQDRVAYRSFISGEIVSFLSAVLDGDCESLQYIEVNYFSLMHHIMIFTEGPNPNACGGHHNEEGKCCRG